MAHSDAEVAMLFDDVLRVADAEGVLVFPHNDEHFVTRKQRARFYEGAQIDEHPRIYLWSEDGDTLAQGLLELLFLAHEMGHWESSRRGEAPSALVDCSALTEEEVAELPEQVRREVLAEEVHAWRLGAELLKRLGFRDMIALSEHAQASLDRYAEGLSLPSPVFALP